MVEALVATEQGLFSTRSSDVAAFEGRNVTSLSPDGRWAVIDRRELWKNAASWDLVASSDLGLQCVLPAGDEVFAGSAEAHLLELFDDRLEIVPGFEEVEGRDDWFTPWGGPPDVRSIAASSSGEIYVNVHVGGIVKGDGDAKWEPTLDISADVHEVRVSENLVIAACAVGLAESGDAGFAWNYDHEGLHATYARAIAAGDESLFMSVSHGPRGGEAAIYRQPCDGARCFERCDLPTFTHNIDTGCLDASGRTVAFGTRDGEVYGTEDNGDTWTAIAGGLPPVQHVVIRR
jgi:hypothetical protein